MRQKPFQCPQGVISFSGKIRYQAGRGYQIPNFRRPITLEAVVNSRVSKFFMGVGVKAFFYLNSLITYCAAMCKRRNRLQNAKNGHFFKFCGKRDAQNRPISHSLYSSISAQKSVNVL